MIVNTGAKIVDLGDGIFVESDVLRVVEQVRAYDENLDIICLNPNADHDVSDAPYILVEKCKDGQWRPVAHFWKLDETVMQVVEAADHQRNDLVAVIQGKQIALRKDQERKFKDMREERKDIVASIAGMKSKFTVTDPRTGELIAFYDDRPAVRGEDNIRGKISL